MDRAVDNASLEASVVIAKSDRRSHGVAVTEHASAAEVGEPLRLSLVHYSVLNPRMPRFNWTFCTLL